MFLGEQTSGNKFYNSFFYNLQFTAAFFHSHNQIKHTLNMCPDVNIKIPPF
jgi:hypothetical protein